MVCAPFQPTFQMAGKHLAPFPAENRFYWICLMMYDFHPICLSRVENKETISSRTLRKSSLLFVMAGSGKL
jgi:hypothetical protein